jgi:hypothetical protein
MAVSLPPIVSDKPQATIPTVLRTTDEVYQRMADGGPFVFLGDNHGSQLGHETLAALMPTLTRANVTALGMELPYTMNPFLHQLQDDIVAQKLTVDDVTKKLTTEFARLGLTMTSGDQAIKDLAGVIHAATDSSLAVYGIDMRNTPVNVMRDRSYASVFGSDANNAFIAIETLKQLAPGERMAINFGANHACLTGPTPRMVEEIKARGYGVTTINLDPSSTLPNQDCRAPVTTTLANSAIEAEAAALAVRISRGSLRSDTAAAKPTQAAASGTSASPKVWLSPKVPDDRHSAHPRVTAPTAARPVAPLPSLPH